MTTPTLPRRPARPARRAFALASLAACALAASSCKEPPAQETLLIAGSTTMESYLQPVVDAFMKKNPGTKVVCESGGSTAGLIALKRGAIDIATLARDVAADEDDVNLKDYLVARDGVAVVVHPQNPVQSLRVADLARIFTGEVTSWKDVGGPEGRIEAIDREKSSRTRKSFTDLALSGEDIAGTSRTVGSAREMVDAVKASPLAIGFLALKDIKPDVRAIPVDGVEMNRATMLSGRYPLTRSFYLAVHMKPTKLAESFITYALGKEGQAILVEDGLLNVY